MPSIRVTLFLLVFSLISIAYAWPAFPSLIPNGDSVAGVRAIGHVDPTGSGAINKFGQEFSLEGFVWTPEFCAMDSDGDGQSNGLELGDPCCTWKKGQQAHRSSDTSNPADATAQTTAAFPDCEAPDREAGNVDEGANTDGEEGGGRVQSHTETEQVLEPSDYAREGECTRNHPNYDYVRNECIGDREEGDGCDNDMACESSFCYQSACREERMSSYRYNAIIVDDFYNNPDDVRQSVLEQGIFTQTEDSLWPQTLSWMNQHIRTAIQERVAFPITHWPTDDGVFTYTTQDSKDGPIRWMRANSIDAHPSNHQFGALLYLTPKAPLTGGMRFFCHRETRLCSAPIHSDATRLGTTMDDLMGILEADSETPEAWIPIDYVANHYNRLVIFSGDRFHKESMHFGTSKATGNLFQLFTFESLH